MSTIELFFTGTKHSSSYRKNRSRGENVERQDEENLCCTIHATGVTKHRTFYFGHFMTGTTSLIWYPSSETDRHSNCARVHCRPAWILIFFFFYCEQTHPRCSLLVRLHSFEKQELDSGFDKSLSTGVHRIGQSTGRERFRTLFVTTSKSRVLLQIRLGATCPPRLV